MKVFHTFRLDSLNQCLWHGDRRVTTTPKAFEVLRYLVEHPGRLVTQEEILEAVWPKAYVNQEVVKKYILGVRKVLGDRHHEPLFIETLPRRGYQFIAPVLEEDSAAPEPSAAPGRSRIVGRDDVSARLDALLDKAVNGQRQLIFVTGEPGIGKTTLVDAFRQRAARRANLRIAGGQCVEGFGSKEPYYPMLEAVGQLTRNREGAPIVQTLAARAPTWLIQFPSLVKAGQREALQREIMGATRERMVREICEALEALSSQTALVLVLEDLQWVDPSTLDVISALARRRDAAKLAVLATYRPSDVALSQNPLKSLKSELHLHRLCEEIVLERLVPVDVARYVAMNFGEGLPAGLAKLVHRLSSGNPLFMAAIVRDMQERRWITQHEGVWKLAVSLESIDPGIPETLQQALDIQFDRLSPREQRVVRGASVAGERFSVWLISSAVDLPLEEIEEICEGLAEREQLITAAGIDEVSSGIFAACYEFSHALYREGIYRRLSELSRSRLHRKIADRLLSLRPPDPAGHELAAELARHFEYGHDYAQAIRYLIEAAENAGARFAYRESVGILQHALELTPKAPAGKRAHLECEIHEFVGDAHYALGAMAESAASYEAGATRAAEAGLGRVQVSALSSLIRPLGLLDPDRGIAAIARATQVSDRLDDPLLAARTRMLAVAVRLLYDGWRSEDAELCTSAYETIRQLGDDRAPSYHTMIYGHVRALQGNYAEALAIFDQVNSKLDGPASLITHFFALSGKTVALLRSGRLGEVLRIVRDGQAMAATNGNDPWLFNFREAWLRMMVFDFKGALRVCESMLSAVAEYPTEQPQTIARISEGYAYLDCGNTDRAIGCFSLVADVQPASKFFLHWLWRMTAQLALSNAWLSSGNLINARSSADHFLGTALSTPDPYFRALAWDLKARLAMAAGDGKGAREHIDQALSILENFVVPMAAWQVNGTAREWNLRVKNGRAAEMHRADAAGYIIGVANSFMPDEPLRASFLAAAPIQGIVGQHPDKRRGRTSATS